MIVALSLAGMFPPVERTLSGWRESKVNWRTTANRDTLTFFPGSR